MNQNYVQIIVFALLIGFSGLSWLFRKLKEQAEIKQARDLAERRTAEMLRTGRDPDSDRPIASAPIAMAGAEPAPSLSRDQAEQQRELAERRRQQLRQLRDRLAGKPPAAPSTGPVAGELWPGGPVVVIGPSRSPAPAGPTPGSAPRPSLTPPTPRPATMRMGPASPPGSPRQASPRTAEQTFRPKAKKKVRRPDAPPSQKPAPAARSFRQPEPDLTVQREPIPIGAAYVPTDIDSWRQAFVAAEIISAPIGIRGPSAVGLYQS